MGAGDTYRASYQETNQALPGAGDLLSREGGDLMVYVVEIRGRGVMPYDFATKAEAEAYAVSMTAWQGGAYRIHRIARAQV